jgi:hypothetical protein
MKGKPMKKVAFVVFSLLVILPSSALARNFPSNGVSVHASYIFVFLPIACSYERYIDVGKSQLGVGAGVFATFLIMGNHIGGPFASISILLGQASLRFEAKFRAQIILFSFYRFREYIDDAYRIEFSRIEQLRLLPGVDAGLRLQGSESPFFCRFTLGFPDGVGVSFGYTF